MCEISGILLRSCRLQSDSSFSGAISTREGGDMDLFGAPAACWKFYFAALKAAWKISEIALFLSGRK